MNNINTYILLFLVALSCTKPEEPLDYFECLKNCKSWSNTEEFDPTKEYKLNYDCLNGSIIPDFTYVNLEGDKKKIRNNNQYILLNFWFIGCAPCIEEIPELILINNQDNINVISIALDNENDLKEFLKTKSDLNYEIIPNGKSLIRDTLQLPFAYPTNYLINPDNIIVDLYDQLNKESAQEIIRLSNS